MKARRLLVPSLGAALFFSLGAFAQDAGSTAGQGGSQNTASADKPAKESGAKKSKKSGGMDQMFVKKAAEGGLAEVDLGNVAKSNAGSDDVKQFGDRMVTDHSKANDELKGLAQQKGWTLPAEPDAKDKATKDRLSKKNGADFDKAYMRDMVMDHEKDVKEFERCAKSCQDSDLKSWAEKTVPTLQDHLKMAKETAQKVGALNGGAAGEKSSKKGKKGGSSEGAGEKPSGAIQ